MRKLIITVLLTICMLIMQGCVANNNELSELNYYTKAYIYQEEVIKAQMIMTSTYGLFIKPDENSTQLIKTLLNKYPGDETIKTYYADAKKANEALGGDSVAIFDNSEELGSLFSYLVEKLLELETVGYEQFDTKKFVEDLSKQPLINAQVSSDELRNKLIELTSEK